MSTYTTSDRQKEEVEILGQRVFLFERTATEVISYKEMASQTNLDEKSATLLAAMVIVTSLRHNFAKLRWYQLIKWIKLKRLCNSYRLMRQLSLVQLFSLSTIVLSLESNDKEQHNKLIEAIVAKKQFIQE